MSETLSQNAISTAKQIIEAVIFASEEPLSLKQILTVVNQSFAATEMISLSISDITTLIDELNQEYEISQRAFQIISIAEGFQFATKKQYSHWLGELFKEKIKRKLSQSALETLSVIAYKQPVSKPEIESIRGVNADYIISSLLERNLITIVGRSASVGRPLLYGTTEYFLHHFGLNSISDLPRLREIEELMKESEMEVEKRIIAEENQQAKENVSIVSDEAVPV